MSHTLTIRIQSSVFVKFTMIQHRSLNFLFGHSDTILVKKGISVSDGLVSPFSGILTVLTSCSYKLTTYNGLILALYSMLLTSIYFFHYPVAADFPTTGNDRMQAPFAASLPTVQPVVQVGAQANAQPSAAATLQAYSAQKRSGTCVFL